MKKLLCVVLFMVILAVPMFAQSDMMFGIKGGITMGRISAEAPDGVDEKFRMGFSGGGMMAMELDKNIHLGVELLYVQKGEKWENGGEAEAKIDVIEVPVLIKFFPIKNMNIYGGPNLNYVMSAKFDTGDTEIDLLDEDLVKNLGFGLSLGTQYMIDKIVLDARYDIGMSDYSEDEFGDELKFNTIYLSVGYLF